MSWIAAATVGGAVIGGVLSSNAQTEAADTAANAQLQASNTAANAQIAAAAAGEAGINNRFSQVQALLKPYVDAGQNSLFMQSTLAGINGDDAQRQAIEQLQRSPAFTSLLARGENSILQNASATGGLRGGNTQAALAQFSPQLMAQIIEQQYARLGGITSIGQNAAAGTGNAGMNAGNTVANLLMNAGMGQANAALSGGAAQAGAALAGGRAQAGLFSTLGGAAGMYGGLGGFRAASGAPPSAPLPQPTAGYFDPDTGIGF